MPHIFNTRAAGSGFGIEGKFFYARPSAVLPYADEDIVDVTPPAGVNRVALKPCGATYNGESISRIYFTGGWTDNLVFTEHFALLRQGILPPPYEVIAGAGAGDSIGVVAAAGPGRTGNAIFYFSWWDDLHGRRSSLSAPSPTIALANQSASITNLPTSAPDPSVTHIEEWCSMDGDLPRLVTRRQIGATSITENVATLSFGEAFTEDFGLFPRCRWNVVWHDRQVMAGDDRFPDRLYLSLLNEPERYGGFFIRTRKGERIVGVIVIRDNLIVLGSKSSYIVTGYTEDDIAMDILEPGLGTVNHHAMVLLLNGLAIIPTHLGISVCTGSTFHFIAKDFQWLWRYEYKENQAAYETDAFAVDDIEGSVYKLWVGDHSLNPQLNSPGDIGTYWILDYTPVFAEVGGNFGQPNLSLDVRRRKDAAAAILSKPGAKRGELFTGSYDGFVRQENVISNDDDDGDTFLKKLIIAPGHYYFGEEGGDPLDSFTYTGFWNFMESELNAYDLDLFTGDEKAYLHVSPDYHETVPAGLKIEGEFDDELAPETVYACKPMRSGRGISPRISVVSPKAPSFAAFNSASGSAGTQPGVVWRGFGCSRIPGPNSRQRITNFNIG